MPNFYDLKKSLHFPDLCGAIRRKGDAAVLYELLRSESSSLRAMARLIRLNKQTGNDMADEAAAAALERFAALHEADMKKIDAYMKQEGIEGV